MSHGAVDYRSAAAAVREVYTSQTSQNCLHQDVSARLDGVVLDSIQPLYALFAGVTGSTESIWKKWSSHTHAANQGASDVVALFCGSPARQEMQPKAWGGGKLLAAMKGLEDQRRISKNAGVVHIHHNFLIAQVGGAPSPYTYTHIPIGPVSSCAQTDRIAFLTPTSAKQTKAPTPALAAILSGVRAQGELDNMQAYAESEQLGLDHSILVARTVVREFGRAGLEIDDVSLGVENDVFVKSGRVTAMIDEDGDVALALPKDDGSRRYLDVACDDVSEALTAIRNAD